MYFQKKGKENTLNTLELAVKAARERKINNVVISSCTGFSASQLKNMENIENLNIVCVSYVYGFREKGKNVMPEDMRNELMASGIKVLSTTHVLSGAERGISRKFAGAYPVEIIANTLRMFGQGLKVCVEISVMALDAGLIPYGEPVIAIGGTGEGVDTAVIITPSHASSIFETSINEIICKPL